MALLYDQYQKYYYRPTLVASMENMSLNYYIQHQNLRNAI